MMSATDERIAAPAARTATTTPVPAGMTRRQRLVLALLLGSQFMLAVDFSILNVALPKIGAGVGISFANLQWVATAFALPAAGFTLFFGRIADLLGRRRLLLAGMALLAAASLLGGLSVSPGMLLSARVAQGLATALVTPAALSLLTTSFPEGPLRDKALGLNGALLSAGFTTGAVLGGILTDLLSWRWAFFLNVPVGAVVLLLAPRLIAESRSGNRVRLDLPGAVTVTGGLLALIFGVATAGRESWGSASALIPIGVGVVLLVAFWMIEARTAQPLASVRVLKRPTVSWGNLGGLVTFAMESALIFLLTLYLQQVLKYSPLATGLSFGLLGAAAFAGGNLAPRIIGRYGSTATLVTGLAVQGAMNASLFLLGAGRGGLALILTFGTVGAFFHVTAIVAFMVTATSGLPDDEQGLATGLTSMTQQIALTVGIPVLSAIATTRTNALRATRSATDAVLGGVDLAVLVDGLVAVAGAVLIAAFLRRRSTRQNG